MAENIFLARNYEENELELVNEVLGKLKEAYIAALILIVSIENRG